MHVSRVGRSKYARLAGALAYGAALAAGAARLSNWVFTPPLFMIALGLPLAFRLVPRNYLYGMRSPRALWTTEEIWYRQNVITGVAMIAVGVVWLVRVSLG